MASKALISSASPLVSNSNRAGSGPLSFGLGPRSVVLPMSKWGRSFVVKAEDQASGNVNVPYQVKQQDWRHRPALLDAPRYVRAPYRHTENDMEVVLSFDMPGIIADDIAVTIIGDLLNVDALGGSVDASGRNAYNTKVHLPANSLRKDAKALLVNGVLYITVPKIPVDHTTPIIVPVKSGQEV